MQYEEIEYILKSEEPILPSADFARSVKEAIWRDVEIPEPIQFPWLRALPGFLATGLSLLSAALWTFTTREHSAMSRIVSMLYQILASNSLGWIVFVIFLMVALIGSATRLSSL